MRIMVNNLSKYNVKIKVTEKQMDRRSDVQPKHGQLYYIRLYNIEWEEDAMPVDKGQMNVQNFFDMAVKVDFHDTYESMIRQAVKGMESHCEITKIKSFSSFISRATEVMKGKELAKTAKRLTKETTAFGA